MSDKPQDVTTEFLREHQRILLEALAEAQKPTPQPVRIVYKRLRSTYTKRNAEILRPYIDMALRNQEDTMIPYDKFPSVSEMTLYHKVTDAIRWLVNESGEEDKKKYGWFRMMCRIQTTNLGIRLHRVEQGEKMSNAKVSNRQSLKDDRVNTSLDWRQSIMDWTSTAVSDDIQVWDKLTLNQFDMDWVRNTLKQFGCSCIVTANMIKAMKE